MTRRSTALIALLLALGLVVAGCSSSGSSGKSAVGSQLNDQVSNGGGKYAGFGLTPAQPRPSFTLTDTAGKPYAFGTATRGRPTLLFFGYTNCPDVCPTTMADTAVALSKVPASVSAKTTVVFVSTDVKRDTGPVIAKWLSTFAAIAKNTKATFVGLRGTQQQIDAAQAAAHVTLAEDSGAMHSAQLLLYGPDDYARVSFLQSNNEQQAIEHDLPIVAKETS